MRNIKFRAFNRKTKKWHYFDVPQDFYLGKHPNPNWLDLDCWGQYTDMKDNRGRKIFEGDIVSGMMDSPNTLYEFNASPVFFVDGCFSTKVDESWEICLYEASNIEVIGNIHENPELLKEQNK